MANPLLDGPSALDDTDEKTRMLLEWLRQQGSVEDRRNLYGAQLYTPRASSVALMNMPGAPTDMASLQASEEGRLPDFRDDLAGLAVPDTMPGYGPEEQAWRMSMSDQFHGRIPGSAHGMIARGDNIDRTETMLEKLRRELERRKKEEGDDSNSSFSPFGGND